MRAHEKKQLEEKADLCEYGEYEISDIQDRLCDEKANVA